MVVCDIEGIIAANTPGLSTRHEALAERTNPGQLQGTLEDALKGADVFIGVSAPGALQKDWIHTMNDKPIIFAMANSIPEIMPEEALDGGAFIVATGRNDYPNQINNVLAFPGIFRGALDSHS